MRRVNMRSRIWVAHYSQVSVPFGSLKLAIGAPMITINRATATVRERGFAFLFLTIAH